MRPSGLRSLSHTTWVSLSGNDDAADTAESRLHAQQVRIIVLIMCFRGTCGQRNQTMTRKLLQ